MESYQSSDIATQEQSRLPIKAAVIAGGSLLGGTSLLARAMPFLSRFIAQPTAIKGLSKLDPRLGKFIKNGMAAGYTFDEIKKMIGQKFEEEQGQEETQKPQNSQEAMIMNIARSKARREPSEFSRESLMEQQGMAPEQQGQGKEALLQTMQQITQALRQMRGNG